MYQELLTTIILEQTYLFAINKYLFHVHVQFNLLLSFLLLFLLVTTLLRVIVLLFRLVAINFFCLFGFLRRFLAADSSSPFFFFSGNFWTTTILARWNILSRSNLSMKSTIESRVVKRASDASFCFTAHFESNKRSIAFSAVNDDGYCHDNSNNNDTHR